MYFDEDPSSLGQKPQEKKECVRVIIEGPKVQGVGFRQWMVHKASSLKIDGWVRNTGKNVEAVFVGEPTVVREMVQVCYYGPPLATVKKVKEFPFKEDKTIEEGFYQLSTT